MSNEQAPMPQSTDMELEATNPELDRTADTSLEPTVPAVVGPQHDEQDLAAPRTTPEVIFHGLKGVEGMPRIEIKTSRTRRALGKIGLYNS